MFWYDLNDFYVEELDNAFLEVGLQKFISDKADEAIVAIYACYSNSRHGVNHEINVAEVRLKKDDLYLSQPED